MEALMETVMNFNNIFFTITCSFVLRFVECLNLTQSVFKVPKAVAEKAAMCQDFGNRTSWIRTERSIEYRKKSYIVKTEDGYWLTYYRITPFRNRYTVIKCNPVLLHHGLLGTWADWLIQGKEKSLAYQLAGQGFDVWMGNSRGTTYAKMHLTLNSNQREFWNFSFHDMGIRDVSAGIDYILNKTNQKQLIYIGHSQGNTMLYVLLSSKPEYNEKVLFHIGAAPIAAIPHTKSSLALLVPYANSIAETINKFTNGAFLEYNLIVEIVVRSTCEKFTSICKQILFGVFGESPKQFNKDLLLQEVLKYSPSGTSVKNLLHWVQLINPGIFSPYGSSVRYNISKITVPIKFFYGSTDLLGNEQDVYAFYQQLPNPMGCEAVTRDQWNHIDFVYGIEINSLFNDKVIKFVVDATSKKHFLRDQIQKSLRERDNTA